MNEETEAGRPARRWVFALAVAALLVALGAAGYLLFREAGKPAAVKAAPALSNTTGVAGPRVRLRLYFPRNDGSSLGAEQREMRQRADRTEQARELLSELIRGPMKEGLTPSFPTGARVKSMFIDAAGTAYVNFSREIQTDFPGGAWTETLTIYSLVNTLTEDFPEIKQVQLLVEGEVPETLAGHIDTSRPFPPRPALNKD